MRMTGPHIGARISAERKLRGFSQQQLAARAHVSHSLLTKVEQGRRPASPALVTAVARALDVDRGQLTGQPFRAPRDRDHAVHDMVPRLRQEILATALTPSEDRPTPSLPALSAAVTAITHAAERADLALIGERLPTLLADLRLAAHTTSGQDREQVMRQWAQAFGAARGFTQNLGYFDLSTVIANHYDTIAAASGDPLCMTLGITKHAQDLVAVGRHDQAQQLLQQARDQLEPLLASNAPEVLSVFGYLHLRSALATARAADPVRTDEHWREAAAYAARLDGEPNHYGLWFGPSNIGIWGVGLAVELVDGPLAIRRGKQLTISPALPPARLGHHYIDLARAQLLTGHRQASLVSLQSARRISPQQTRYHPMVRETIAGIAHAERRSTESLRNIAAWVGIEP